MTYVLLTKYYLTIEEAVSLKDKRSVVKSIMELVRHKFRCSIAEIDKQNDFNNGVIGLCVISNDIKYLNKLNNNIDNFIESRHPGRISSKQYIIEDTTDAFDYDYE